MSANDSKVYYWLKLSKNFFDNHKIRVIEGLPNGKDYILFYLKLMCESTSHEGTLRFDADIPYDEQMLATITNTNIDVAHNALQIFSKLGMVKIDENGTYILPEVQNLIGKETGMAIRMREYRKNADSIANEVTLYPACNQNVPNLSPRVKSIELRKRKKERDKLSPKKEMGGDENSSLSETETDNDTEQQPMTEEEKKINDEHFKKFVNLYPSWKFGNLTMGYVKRLWNSIENIGDEYPWIMTYVENKLANESRYLPRVDKFLTNQAFRDHDRYERSYNYLTIKEELEDKQPVASSTDLEELSKQLGL
jgi:predicted phage replisome organizer